MAESAQARHFSRYLDRIIDEVLAQRRQADDGRKTLRVVFTGEDGDAAAPSLSCLDALHRAGYGLHIAFSHSAGLSAIKPLCQRWSAARGEAALFDQRGPRPGESTFAGVFLPGLSVNSLAKMALCLCDNLACQWAFHALAQQKQVIATLHARGNVTTALAAQRAQYAERIRQYGVVISGAASVPPPADVTRPPRRGKALISLSDILLLPAGEALFINDNTLITPAARDEIRRRHITLTHRR